MLKYRFLVLPLIILFACSESPESDLTSEKKGEVIEFYGNTQGTTFAVIVNDDIDLTMEEIETVLHNFDLALSSYIPNSILTGINESPAGVFEYKDEFGYFNRCYQLSQKVYQLTSGAFDPTVYPLVDGWGFMKNLEVVPDSTTVDSLRALLGFANGYHFDFTTTVENGDTIPKSLIVKNTPGAKLDFNAIAQGLSVDVLAELIEKKGGKNYFVEIGGEIRVKGINREGSLWRIGIDQPIEDSDAENRKLQEIVLLDNQSIATSGSYRKYYEQNGTKYSHTLDPKTGYPVIHKLLSSTVVTESCAMADGLATALMVMGPQKSIDFIVAHPELKAEIYLIFTNEKGRIETYASPGFQKMLAE